MESRSEEQRQDMWRRVYKRCLAGFFLAMALCTLISRVWDSVMVPKVVCQRMKEKNVENVIEGTGVVRETDRFFCRIVSGLGVKAVKVEPGSLVEEGDVLFVYNEESLKERQTALREELERLYLDLEGEEIAGQIISQVTETELADKELELANRELEEGRQEYERKALEHDKELERLKTEYERKQTLTREELWLSQDQEEEAMRQELSSAKNSRNAALKEARRKVDDLEEKLAEMKEGEYGERDLARAERDLERAREDLDALEEDWEDRIEDVESRMDLIDDRNERILSGETNSQAALQEAYEASVRQEEESWTEEKKRLEELKKAAERARWNREVSAKRDDSARLGNEQKKRLSEVAKKKLDLDIRKKERELKEIDGLILAQGQVAAEIRGTVVDQEVEAGRTSTGQERLSVAIGEFSFRGEFEKEEQKVAVGDSLMVHIPGESKTIEIVIGQISLLGEKGSFQGRIPQGELPLGTVTTYECRKQSEVYRQVIPIQALRKDTKGYYCLVARPGKTILGEEFRAERMNVEVLYEGSTEVAVKGGLQTEDSIIVRSSQVIGEGERVRLVDGF